MNTAIRNFTPAPGVVWLYERGYINPGDILLDYGAGHGRNTNFLENHNINVFAYDPYTGTNDPESKISTLIPDNEYDIVLTSYVLNVVDRENEKKILSHIRNNIPHKREYHIVRDDVESVEGHKTSRGFQRLVRLENFGFSLVKHIKGKWKLYSYQEDYNVSNWR